MSKFNTGQSFADGDTVTGAKLNNITGLLDIYTGLISEQTAIAATVSTADQLLIADTDNGDSGAANRVTIQKLLNDTLTNGTYTDVNLTGNLNVAQLSTLGTLNNTRGTVGILNSTTGTIQSLTSSTANISQGSAIFTQGTIGTLNTTTGTIGTLNNTTGTIATLNSTTGTIGTLVATGTITGSTNVVNIGSGQIYKDASGNVGIGTVSPINKLHLYNGTGSVGATQLELEGLYNAYGAGINFSSRTSSGGTLVAMAKITADGEDSWNTTGTTQDAGLRFSTAQNGTLAERLRIDSSGQVGIGVSSPISSLHLKHATPTSKITLEDTSTNRVGQIGGGSDGSGGLLTFSVGNNGGTITERLRIDSSGNVGIGVAAPVNKLEVVGSFGRGAPVTKTADFTLADTENWLIVNKGSSCTVTLPAASSWTGREFTIKVITAHAVVSATAASIVPRIGGAAGTAILPATDGAWATLVSNGTTWEIMCGS
jgi:hypothetical protein